MKCKDVQEVLGVSRTGTWIGRRQSNAASYVPGGLGHKKHTRQRVPECVNNFFEDIWVTELLEACEPAGDGAKAKKARFVQLGCTTPMVQHAVERAREAGMDTKLYGARVALRARPPGTHVHRKPAKGLCDLCMQWRGRGSLKQELESLVGTVRVRGLDHLTPAQQERLAVLHGQEAQWQQHYAAHRNMRAFELFVWVPCL